MNSATLALALLCLAGVARPQSLPPGEAPPEAVNLPGGVANAAGTVLYLTSLWSGVVALDAQDGRVLWESKEAMHPLALVGKRLVALGGARGQLRIAVLDAEGGSLAKESEPLAIPAWVDPRPHEDSSEATTHFGARAWAVDGGVRVQWSARLSYSGGPNRGPPYPKGSPDHAFGTLEMDLESCALRPLPNDGIGDALVFDEGVPVRHLPAQVHEAAKLGQWESGRAIGGRAYGKCRRLVAGGSGARAKQVMFVQAVDLATGKLLWERSYEEVPLGSPDAVRRP